MIFNRLFIPKMCRRLSVLFICFFCTATLFAANKQAIHFVGLADIHFDPFISCYSHPTKPCALIHALQKTAPSTWPALFSHYDQTLPQYGQDTNYALLMSMLNAANKVGLEKHAQFVLVLGDFLAHDFKTNYLTYSNDHLGLHYAFFVKKTLSFLTSTFAKTFPTMDVYTLAGNNDSYLDDYVVSPKGKFFKDMSVYWSGLIKDKKTSQSMQRQFSANGYYAVNMPQHPELRLIMLNTVLFSDKAKGKGIHQAANQEFDWLHQELDLARTKHQQVLIAMHIPPKIDVYATQNIHLFTLMDLWRPHFQQRFQDELSPFSSQITGILAAHLHVEWIHIQSLKNAQKALLMGLPAISPLYNTSPGFKVYHFLLPDGQLQDEASYYYSFHEQQVRGAVNQMEVNRSKSIGIFQHNEGVK